MREGDFDRLADLHRAMCLLADAGRIFSRLGDLLSQGRQPPMSGALSLTDFDA